LQETLRYEYGADGSRQFFEECETRLEFIRQEIANTPNDEHGLLETQAGLLNGLSDLIARIERSSIGEYSWPFVDELKKIAEAICTENTLTREKAPPTVHVLSDGGLDKYAINPEQKRPSGGTRRILTIVFPRSLKHFVLLHPILGHELGHAIWRGSEHESLLKRIIAEKLLNLNDRFKDADAAAAWMYSADAPPNIQAVLSVYKTKFGVEQSNFFPAAARWAAWVEEMSCDIIGLLIFGPSFVAALCQLLYALVPSGTLFGQDHPPVGCRINMMLTASRLLGYDKFKVADKALQAELDRFWSEVAAQRQANVWFDIFTDHELASTFAEIDLILQNHPPAQYPTPDPVQFEKLLWQISSAIPPVDVEMADNGVPIFSELDFRHILYAGWVISKGVTGMSFLDINRLCEHGIMQLGAINIYRNG
jgi:hypothetical protein